MSNSNVLNIKKLVSPATHGLTSLLSPKLGNVLDSGQDGIVLLDTAGLIMEMNTEARKFLNCLDADLSGRDF